MYNVRDYGAVGNGTTNDQPAIMDAVEACKAAGGGTVYFPKGVYLLTTSETIVVSEPPNPATQDSHVCIPIDGDNIHVLGDGIGNTILKLGNNVNAKVVGFGACKNNSIQKIEVDGNRANQTSEGVLIYSFGNLTDFLIRDCFVHHSEGYGVGLAHGALRNVLLENVLIEDTGQDGFDNKNGNGLDKGNRMSNVTVRRAGLDTSLSGQTCIDMRGEWVWNNLICEDFNHTSARCKTGIRFRPDNPTDGAVGSHKSSGSTFYVKPSSPSGTIGVEINGSYNSITGGVVEGCEIGVVSNGLENKVVGVTALSCGDGFLAENTSMTNGDRPIFSACVARSCTSGFKSSVANAQFMNIVARSNTHGVNLRNGSVNTIISGLSSSNSGSNLNKESSGLTWKDAGFVY